MNSLKEVSFKVFLINVDEIEAYPEDQFSKTQTQMLNIEYKDLILAESDPVDEENLDVEKREEMQPIKEESGSKREATKDRDNEESIKEEYDNKIQNKETKEIKESRKETLTNPNNKNDLQEVRNTIVSNNFNNTFKVNVFWIIINIKIDILLK